MKISTNSTQDYQRMVEPAVDAKSEDGETALDPLHRTVDQTPVEAVEHGKETPAVEAHRDTVVLSPIAQALVTGQEKVEESIQEEIQKAFEAERVDLSEHQGMDYAPDAVAQRIVDSTISLYGVFRDNNASMEAAQALGSFEGTLRAAIEDGHNRAMEELRSYDAPQSVLDRGQETLASTEQALNRFFEEERAGQSLT